MGCNCTSKTQQDFLFTAPDGTQTVYTSEVQAQAARIRNGGGSYETRVRASA